MRRAVIDEGRRSVMASPNAKSYSTGKAGMEKVVYTPKDGGKPFTVGRNAFEHSLRGANAEDNAVVGRHLGEALDASTPVGERSENATFRIAPVRVNGEDAHVLFTVVDGKMTDFDVLKGYNTKKNPEGMMSEVGEADSAKAFEVRADSIANLDRAWQERFKPGLVEHAKRKGGSLKFTAAARAEKARTPVPATEAPAAPVAEEKPARVAVPETPPQGGASLKDAVERLRKVRADKASTPESVAEADAAVEAARAPDRPFDPTKPRPNAKSAAKAVGEFAGKDEERPALLGAYHDKANGVVVATDGRILIATRHGFDPNAADRKYPDWKEVVPADKELTRNTTVNPSALAKACAEAVRLTRATGVKDSDDIRAKVVLRFGDRLDVFDAELMGKVARAMEANGITEIRAGDKFGPVAAKNGDTTIVAMPLRRDHGFTERQIVALPEAYGQPAAVFIDGKAYVVLTGMQVATRGGSEKPVMVVLRESVDRNGRHEFLASAYPREEANENFYSGLARNGKMLFLDKNKVAVIGLNGRTISTLNEQADGNRVKTPEDLSSVVSGGSMPNSGGGVNGGEAKFAVGKLYTGSAADYERPSLVHVGTGEGAQVYGWGLYASDRRGIAEEYARTTKKKAEKASRMFYRVDGKRVSEAEVAESEGNDTAYGLGMVAKGHSRAEVADYLDDLAEGQSNPGSAASLRKAARFLREHEIVFEKQSAPTENVYEQTFFTDRAPGDESHLLKWYEPVSEEQGEWILDTLKDMGSNGRLLDFVNREREKDLARDGLTWRDVEGEDAAPDYYPDDVLRDYLEQYLDLAATGGELYGQLSEALGSPKAASEFLARAGIDGVKYPADSYGGKGVKDGDAAGWNYVSFRDDNIRVDHKWTDGVAKFSAGRREDALKEMRPIETHRVASSYAEARTALAPQVGKIFRNKETGVEATLSNNSVNKLLSGKAVAKSVGVKEHLAAVANVTDLFENGRLLATDEGSRKGVLSAKRFFSRFRYNGEDLIAKTTVLEYERGDHRIYSVEAMEVEKAGSILAPKGSTNQAENPALPSTPRIVPQSGPSAQGGAKLAAGGGSGRGRLADAFALDPRAEVLPGGVRVAADAGRGERTPGGLASSRELSSQGTTPLTAAGRVHPMALPVSEMVWLYRELTGSAVPPRVARRLPGGAAAAHTRAGGLSISADVFGIVDRTDAAREKARLKEHGFYRDEDADWCASQTPAAVRAERARSDGQLGEQLRLLGERRVRGEEAGGQAAARGVFAHELAKVVMEMPRTGAGVVGRVQRIGDAVRREVAAAARANGADAEGEMRGAAGTFLDWANGGPLADPETGARVGRGQSLSLRELTDGMFGAFLTMPQEMRRRAPAWYDAIARAISSDARLSAAFRELSLRGGTGRAHEAVAAEIRRSMSRATAARLAELEREANEPISAGSALDDAKETVLVALHDRMAPVVVRIDAKAKVLLKAKREALKARQ